MTLTHQNDTKAPQVTVLIIAIGAVVGYSLENFWGSIVQSETRCMHWFLLLNQSGKPKVNDLDVCLISSISEKQVLQGKT